MTETLRLFIVLGSLSATVMIVILNRKRDPFNPHPTFGHMMTRAGTCLVLLSIAYATAESQWRGIPGAPRLWVLAGGLVWLNVGCIATLRERRKRRKGSDG